LTLTYQTDNSPPTGVIGIDFDANSTAGAGGNFYLDNFQLGVTPAPEPGTCASCGMGLLMMTVWRRRRSVGEANTRSCTNP
jgi:hypothetical protein